MAGLDANNSATAMTFSVAEGDDRTVTVTVSGELDISNVEALGSAVAPALEHDPVRLIVDARELTFADSSAIALWVLWSTAVPEIELRDAPPLLRRVVDTMGLTKTLNPTP
ncbi:MAG: STAS domain-containing protein [Solirubrobacterales bacterium]|nr:STAS domain-containing protein [Solirubrobacterales bacterium]